MLNATIMSKPETSRDYSLRSVGKCTKYYAHSCDNPKEAVGCDSFETPPCMNCKSLSIDNDKLRRQIAILQTYIDKQSIHSDSAVAGSPKGDVKSTQSQTPCIMLKNTSCGTETPVKSVKVFPGTSVASGTSDNSHMITLSDGNNHIIWPYYHHDHNVFKKFDVLDLGKDTTYTHVFSNRSVAYYGSLTYSYTGGSHPPRPFHDNKYLMNILTSVKELYPDYKFNSAMITCYADGDNWMPFHSDDETCIAANSSIMTISLGETRSLQFQSKNTTTIINDTELSLEHGDVFLMSQESQSFFQHSIPKDTSCRLQRISITLRLLSGDSASDSHVNGTSQPIPPPVKDVRKTNAKSSCNSDQESTQKTNRDRVLYISSSMFKSLDETRLSSKSTDALVFSYPGATVSSIEEKFRGDKRISHVDPNTIKTIILMCGTNNVDSILGSPKHMRDKLLSEKTPYSCDMESMSETFQSIEHFLVYLNEWAPYAKIKVLNILPRESKVRNEVITRINSYIFSLAQRFAFVEHPDSMANRSYLFAYKSGFRKSIFFSSYGSDNVHLNQKGVTRLARYLKYIAHNH